MIQPVLMDAFCCSGIAAEGYARAGFDVLGIDIDPQPRYPFTFFQRDAMLWLADIPDYVDVVHASPPCQRYSDLAKRNGNADDWPDLIPEVRELLDAWGGPYVIENVEGAPLDGITLCGTMFPGLRVLRHRVFESNVPLVQPPHPRHPLVFTHDKRKAHYGRLDQDTSFVQVTGGGNCTMANARSAMGLPADDRRTKHELNEGIPAAYTEFIGYQLRAALLTNREAVAA